MVTAAFDSRFDVNHVNRISSVAGDNDYSRVWDLCQSRGDLKTNDN